MGAVRFGCCWVPCAVRGLWVLLWVLQCAVLWVLRLFELVKVCHWCLLVACMPNGCCRCPGPTPRCSPPLIPYPLPCHFLSFLLPAGRQVGG